APFYYAILAQKRRKVIRKIRLCTFVVFDILIKEQKRKGVQKGDTYEKTSGQNIYRRTDRYGAGPVCNADYRYDHTADRNVLRRKYRKSDLYAGKSGGWTDRSRYWCRSSAKT